MAELNLQVNETNNEFRAETAGGYALNPASLWAGWHQGASRSYGIGARFRDVTIPNSSVIEEAYITLTCKATNVWQVSARASAEQADDPADFSGDDYASVMARWATRTDPVDWDDGGWSVVDAEHDSPDIKAVIQAIVNRPGWVSGNHLVIFWEDWEDRSDHVDAALHNAWPYAQEPLKTVKLYVRYAPVVLPTVTTDLASSVVKTTATPNGTLDGDGGEACDCGFEWGETESYGNTTPTQSKTTGQTFAQAISGLSPNTTYHFRAFATNSAGTSYGSDQTFTTLIDPTAITNPATSIEEIAATLNGTLDDDGGEACDCGFEYGETTDYGTTTPTESKETGEAFSQDITGLTGKHYHFRAIAINAAGTSYGIDRGFFVKGRIKGNPNIDQLIYQHVERMGPH